VGFATEDGKNFLHYDSSTRTTGGRVDLERLLAPVVPGKIVAVGLNYRDHAREMAHEIPKEPVLFIKPSTAVIGPGEAIRYPSQSSRVDYEAELAVVIGSIRPGFHSRVHLLQRCHCARPPGKRRTVDPCEIVRHVRTARTVDRNRSP
jgi:hypothetical protein